MDRKSITFMAVCLAGMVGLKFVGDWIWPTPLRPLTSTNSVSLPRSDATSGVKSTGGSVESSPTANLRPMLTTTNVPRPSFNTAEVTEILENDIIKLSLTSHGGGVRLIELKKYPASEQLGIEKEKLTGEVVALNRFASSPALTLGVGPLTGDGLFTLQRRTGGLRAEKKMENGLVVSQDYSLSNGYFFNTTVTLENRGQQTLALPGYDFAIGSATPMDRMDKAEVQGAYWFDGNKAEQISAAWFANATFGCATISTPRTEFLAQSTNIVWAAVHNQFFAMIDQPNELPLGVRVRQIILPAPSAVEWATNGALNPAPQAFETSFVYGPSELKPGDKVIRSHTVYAGPKEYRQLKNSDKQIDLVMDFTGITGFCAKALLLLLNGLHDIIPSYGWSIVVLTVLIKLTFWPLTNASTRSMKRMSALQPQINAIKEKYKKDPQKMNEKTMAFMKENKVNPMAGCLPLLLTFPVFIGFFFMLRTSIELRGSPFLWCSDLSRPDTLALIPGLGFLPMIGITGVGLPLNLMPVLYLGTAWWLSTLTPASPQMDPAQQKMLRYMPVFFGILFYNYSAGLTLYWTVQNLMSILQTKSTKAQSTGPSVTTVTSMRRN